MNWKLFLDDERMPAKYDLNTLIARNKKEVAEYILYFNSLPTFISFDHDLGKQEPTGYDIAKWLVELDMAEGFYNIPKDFTFYVHSQNPIGKKNIEMYLNNYLEFRK